MHHISDQSVLEWLNARVSHLMERHDGPPLLVEIDVQGDQLRYEDSHGGHGVLALADITRVMAVRRERQAGDETTLLIEARGRAALSAGASCPGWLDLCTALDRVLVGSRPFGQWHAQVMLAGVDAPVQVWPLR